MKVFLLDSIDWQKVPNEKQSKDDIQHVARKSAEKAARLLNHPLEFVNIVIQPNAMASLPEYGVGGFTYNSEFSAIYFDPDFPHGFKKTLINIEATILHEINHQVRWSNIEWQTEVIEGAVFEGLATVFERENSGHSPLYGEYQTDEVMLGWLREINACGSIENPEYQKLRFIHPDGRKWVVYRTGTWIVDRAIANSEKSISELTRLPTAHIMELAKLPEAL